MNYTVNITDGVGTEAILNGNYTSSQTSAYNIPNIESGVVKNVDLAIAEKVFCNSTEEKEKYYGVIGLGFFNAISNSYFSDNITEEKDDEIDLNILSYSLEGDTIELYFGHLFKEQIDYLERLTSCNVILDTESDIQGKKMTCELEGIKSAKYTKAFKLQNAHITFSLGEKNSLILGNNTNYAKYLEKIYFQKGFEIKTENKSDGAEIQYYLYPSDKINKLPNFGFVFNRFFYSYSPKKFFRPDPSGKMRFLVEINKNSNETEFILGKEFLEDIKFTINNEEAKIYFYARNAEFSDKFTEQVDSIFMINLGAKESAAITLSIIIFINLVAFSIFYCVKRKKKDEGDYNRID